MAPTSAREQAFRAVFGLSGTWCIVAAAVAGIIAMPVALSSLEQLLQLLAFVLPVAAPVAGIAAAALVLSLRYYTGWLSWTAWLVLLVPMWLWFDSIRAGMVSIVAVLFAYALSLALIFGLLWLARAPLQRWIMSGPD